LISVFLKKKKARLQNSGTVSNRQSTIVTHLFECGTKRSLQIQMNGIND